MVRVYWTVDLFEAHVVAGLLRSEGVQAFVFDADMVRQDWFRALAIGGYRIVVAPHEVERALPLVERYLGTNATQLYEVGDMPHCSACNASKVADDPRPRRLAFMLYFVPYWGAVVAFAASRGASSTRIGSLLLAAYTGLCAAFYCPGVLAWLVKHRYVCLGCGRRFRDNRGMSYAALSAAATAAETRVE